MKVTLSKIQTMDLESSESELQEDLKLAKKYGWTVTHIDGNEIECFCIYCNKPLFDSSEYYRDADGEPICEECLEKIKKENNK